MAIALDQLNHVTPADFTAATGDTFERAPWIAAAVAARRPFATVTALHEAMMGALSAAPRGQPDLAAKAVLTDDSAREQASVGLDSLGKEERVRFHRLNDAYKARFGFPFMICVRRHTRDSILTQFERRLHHDAATEFARALQEVDRKSDV